MADGESGSARTAADPGPPLRRFAGHDERGGEGRREEHALKGERTGLDGAEWFHDHGGVGEKSGHLRMMVWSDRAADMPRDFISLWRHALGGEREWVCPVEAEYGALRRLDPREEREPVVKPGGIVGRNLEGPLRDRSVHPAWDASAARAKRSQ